MVPGHLPTFGLAPRPVGTPWGGEYTLERLAGGVRYLPLLFPYGMSPPDGPHIGDFYRCFGLSWETSSHSRVLFT